MSILQHIQNKPTVVDKVHESVYRSYSILELVKDMLMRKDSTETILTTIEFLEERPKSDETIKQATK